MPIVDIHAHIYPEKIAQKAADAVGDFYLAPMYGDGSVNGPVGLLAASVGSPITHFVVHSVAVKPQTVESINNFIMNECAAHENFIGFMAMHQDYENPEAEIDRALEQGLCGLKLHPDTQRVNADDPRLMRVYEICEDRHVPVIIHTGDYRYDFSHPRRIVNILHTFPNLVVDAAHFGGWSIFDYGTEILENERCYVDTSSATAWLGPRRTAELIRIYGTKRVLFGADFPMWSPREEYEFISALDFTDDEFADIFWHNAERFIGRTIG